MLRNAIAIFLLFAGVFFCLLSLYGLFRLQGAMNKIHAAALSSAVGVPLLLLGLCVFFGFRFISLKLLLILLLLWIGAPITANRIAKMELVLRGLSPKILFKE